MVYCELIVSLLPVSGRLLNPSRGHPNGDRLGTSPSRINDVDRQHTVDVRLVTRPACGIYSGVAPLHPLRTAVTGMQF